MELWTEIWSSYRVAFASVFVVAAGIGTAVAVLSRAEGDDSAALVALQIVRAATAVTVVVWLVLFAALILRARLILGFWPYPTHHDPAVAAFPYYRFSPLDPKDLGIHTSLLWMSLPVVAACSIACLGILVGGMASGRPSSARGILELSAFVLFWACWVFDPGLFFSWFCD